MDCKFCTDYFLRATQCELPAAHALLNAEAAKIETDASIAADGYTFGEFGNRRAKIDAARTLISAHPESVGQGAENE